MRTPRDGWWGPRARWPSPPPCQPPASWAPANPSSASRARRGRVALCVLPLARHRSPKAPLRRSPCRRFVPVHGQTAPASVNTQVVVCYPPRGRGTGSEGPQPRTPDPFKGGTASRDQRLKKTQIFFHFLKKNPKPMKVTQVPESRYSVSLWVAAPTVLTSGLRPKAPQAALGSRGWLPGQAATLCAGRVAAARGSRCALANAAARP